MPKKLIYKSNKRPGEILALDVDQSFNLNVPPYKAGHYNERHNTLIAVMKDESSIAYQGFDKELISKIKVAKDAESTLKKIILKSKKGVEIQFCENRDLLLSLGYKPYTTRGFINEVKSVATIGKAELGVDYQ